MLNRVLEPELMDTPEEARDYDAMDHAEVNARFCQDLLAHGPVGPAVLDIGTGTALIPIELCQRAEGIHVVAVDLADNMLAFAGKNVTRAGLQNRIMLEKIDAKAMPYDSASFATTISNSIIHHIPDPRAVLREVNRVTAKGGLVFIRDLARPESEAEIDRLGALYGGAAPADPKARAAYENQRELLRASLRAALTVEEVDAMAEAAGMPARAVRMTSDRHWTLAFRKP